MRCIYLFFTAFLLLFFSEKIIAQDTTSNFMSRLEKEAGEQKTIYTMATFKTTRVVDGQSVENLPKNVLDVRISHRFDPINQGLYNFFGLDIALVRIGFDYGITNNFMAGIGHSAYQKTYDAFFKYKILRQSEGVVNMPVTLSFVPSVAINTLTQPDSLNNFNSRVSYVFQFLVARKFFDKFSLQLMPTFIHADKISFSHINSSNQTKQDIFAIGIAGSHRISKRVNINAEYYYQLPDMQAQASHNVFSFGFDIGTGGHVFQLVFTNSVGLTEKSFISETTGKWDGTWKQNNIMFGFNISRVFQLKKQQ